MTLLKHPEDRIPVTLFFLFFAADSIVYFTATNPWIPVIWFAAGIVPKGCVCAWNHHHQHVPMFRHAFFNRILELGFALQTGITTNGWTLHHVLGHHVTYLNPIADESGWMNTDGSAMGEIEYTWKNTIKAYPRVWKVGARYPRHRRVFAMAFLWTAAVVIAAMIHNPWSAAWIFVLPMITSLAGTVWVTWFHHANLPTSDPMAASNNTMDAWYNLLLGNLGYHTAHHHRQAVHWSKLPELHAQIADKIPAANYIPAGFPYYQLTAITDWLGRKPRRPLTVQTAQQVP